MLEQFGFTAADNACQGDDAAFRDGRRHLFDQVALMFRVVVTRLVKHD